MWKLILSLLFLPTLLFGASIPFSAANPNQLGVNPSTGQLWITNNPLITNITVFGDANRTNALVITAGGLTVSNAIGSAVTAGGTLVLTNGGIAPSINVSNGNFGFFVTTNGVGIGTNGPINALNILGWTSNSSSIIIRVPTTFVGASPGNTFFNDLGHQLQYLSAGSGLGGTTPNTIPDSGRILTGGTNGLTVISTSASNTAVIAFFIGANNLANRYMVLDTTGALTVTNSTGGTVIGSGAITNTGVGSFTGGVGSYATDAAVNIGATGWTNTLGKWAQVCFDGTTVFYTNLNNALTPWYTNAAAVIHGEVILQPNGAVRISGTGVTGRASPL